MFKQSEVIETREAANALLAYLHTQRGCFTQTIHILDPLIARDLYITFLKEAKYDVLSRYTFLDVVTLTINHLNL